MKKSCKQLKKLDNQSDALKSDGKYKSMCTDRDPNNEDSASSFSTVELPESFSLASPPRSRLLKHASSNDTVEYNEDDRKPAALKEDITCDDRNPLVRVITSLSQLFDSDDEGGSDFKKIRSPMRSSLSHDNKNDKVVNPLSGASLPALTVVTRFSEEGEAQADTDYSEQNNSDDDMSAYTDYSEQNNSDDDMSAESDNSRDTLDDTPRGAPLAHHLGLFIHIPQNQGDVFQHSPLGAPRAGQTRHFT